MRLLSDITPVIRISGRINSVDSQTMRRPVSSKQSVERRHPLEFTHFFSIYSLSTNTLTNVYHQGRIRENRAGHDVDVRCCHGPLTLIFWHSFIHLRSQLES